MLLHSNNVLSRIITQQLFPHRSTIRHFINYMIENSIIRIELQCTKIKFQWECNSKCINFQYVKISSFIQISKSHSVINPHLCNARFEIPIKTSSLGTLLMLLLEFKIQLNVSWIQSILWKLSISLSKISQNSTSIIESNNKLFQFQWTQHDLC